MRLVLFWGVLGAFRAVVDVMRFVPIWGILGAFFLVFELLERCVLV